MAVTPTSRRATRDRRGRDQHRRSHTARQRQPNLARYYRRTKAPLDLDFEFQLDLLRGRGIPPIRLNRFTQSFSWADEESMLTGQLDLTRPDPEDEASLPAMRNLMVRCRVLAGGEWYELWRMRCDPPATDIAPDGVSLSVVLNDDLNLVRRGKRTYLYRATKKRKHGWFGHKALIDAARKDGIRIGRLVKCRKRMQKISVEGSFLDLAKKIYENEAEETGLKYVMRMRNGRFEVVPFRRNRTMHVLAARVLTGVQIETKPKVAKPVTVIVATARVGKGEDAEKITYTHFERRMVARYGWVQKEENFGKVATFEGLRRRVKRKLAEQYEVEKNATVTLPGLPFLRRGDGAFLPLETEGFVKTPDEDLRFVYVRSIRHSVSSGEYTSDVDLTADDPFVKYEEKLEEQKRDEARKRRRRTRGDGN